MTLTPVNFLIDSCIGLHTLRYCILVGYDYKLTMTTLRDKGYTVDYECYSLYRLLVDKVVDKQLNLVKKTLS